jgi:hypothetical protein
MEGAVDKARLIWPELARLYESIRPTVTRLSALVRAQSFLSWVRKNCSVRERSGQQAHSQGGAAQ